VGDLVRSVFIGTALAVLAGVPPTAVAGGTGTHMATFLEVEAGARQMGMGGAFTGLADDAMTVFYNPAGLANLEGSEIHLENTTWAAGVSYQHLAYGFRYGAAPGTVALSWAVMQISPYRELNEYYDPESDLGVGAFDPVDAGDMSFGGSYCWDFGGGLSAGATLHWYHLHMAEAFCEGVYGDAGVLYDTPFRNLRVGAAALNLGPSDRWAGVGTESTFGEEFPLPAVYRVGASIRLYDVVRHRVVVAADYKMPAEGGQDVNAGAEYTFNKGPVFVYGRAGYRAGYDEEGLTLGAGARFPSSKEAEVRVDYAFVDMGHLSYSQRIGVSFHF
jgi:hypothetical protein